MAGTIGVYLGDVYMPVHTINDLPDAYGVRWKCVKFDGWDDGWRSGNAGTVEDRSQQDGAHVAPQYATARVIHLGGRLIAPSWDAAERAWNRLLGQIPFRQLGTIRVSRGDGTLPELTALIRQHEEPVVTRVGGRIDFSFSLIAPDPRKYDSTSRSAALVLPITTGGIAPPLTPPITVTGSTSRSQVTLVNDGNVITYPTHAIVGPCPPARIANLTTSEVLRIPDPVPAGQTLVIDGLKRVGTVGGQSRRVLGSWWGLVSGENELSFWAEGYDAGAQLLTTYRSAWK